MKVKFVIEADRPNADYATVARHEKAFQFRLKQFIGILKNFGYTNVTGHAEYEVTTTTTEARVMGPEGYLPQNGKPSPEKESPEQAFAEAYRAEMTKPVETEAQTEPVKFIGDPTHNPKTCRICKVLGRS